MTMQDIKDAADMAETWPGSGVLDWGEVPWQALADWVTLSVDIGGDAALLTYDVESVKGCFERWWKGAASSSNSTAACHGATTGPHGRSTT